MASRFRSGKRRSIASDIICATSQQGGVIFARKPATSLVTQLSGEKMDMTFAFLVHDSQRDDARYRMSRVCGLFLTLKAK